MKIKLVHDGRNVNSLVQALRSIFFTVITTSPTLSWFLDLEPIFFLSFGNSLALEINKKRNVKYGELALNRINGGFPRYVLNQLKIFVPVGKDIKIVTAVK